MVNVYRSIRTVARGAGLVVLFVVTLEACARIDDCLSWGAPLWGHYSHSLLTTSDDLGPHSRFGARFEKWRVNSHGFRGPEITMEKPEGVTRIIVIGASETFGLYESPGMEFPAQMQQKLDLARPGRYQVLNAGCAGMSLPRFIHYFDVWLKKFDPDIVVYYPTPPTYIDVKAPVMTAPTRSRPRRKLRESIRLKRKTKLVLKGFIPASIQKWVRQALVARSQRGRGPNWLWRDVPPERVQLFEQHLTRLVTDIRASGVRVVLATHANRFPVDRSQWSDVDEMMMVAWRKYYARATESCLLAMEREANHVVVGLGQQLGIPVADAARAVPPAPEHFADFSHFTDRGSSLIAKELVREILSREK